MSLVYHRSQLQVDDTFDDTLRLVCGTSNSKSTTFSKPVRQLHHTMRTSGMWVCGHDVTEGAPRPRLGEGM